MQNGCTRSTKDERPSLRLCPRRRYGLFCHSQSRTKPTRILARRPCSTHRDVARRVPCGCRSLSCAAKLRTTTTATGTTTTRSRVACLAVPLPAVAPFFGFVLGRLPVGEFKASGLDGNCDASLERLDRTGEGPPFDRRAACSRARVSELPFVQARVAVLRRAFREIPIFDK